MSSDPLSDDGLDIGFTSMIRDEPGYRIALAVEAFDEDQGIEMVLRTVNQITWWKSLSYFPHLQRSQPLGPETRIETKNNVHEARQHLYLPNLSEMGVFTFWKGGFMGFGAYAGQMPINGWANARRRIIFTWQQD
jgi:hypothetical protein